MTREDLFKNTISTLILVKFKKPKDPRMVQKYKLLINRCQLPNWTKTLLLRSLPSKQKSQKLGWISSRTRRQKSRLRWTKSHLLIVLHLLRKVVLTVLKRSGPISRSKEISPSRSCISSSCSSLPHSACFTLTSEWHRTLREKPPREREERVKPWDPPVSSKTSSISSLVRWMRRPTLLTLMPASIPLRSQASSPAPPLLLLTWLPLHS